MFTDTTSPEQAYRVMLIERDEDSSAEFADYLGRHNFSVVRETRGDLALQKIQQQTPHLLVLDTAASGKDGFTVCRELRAHGHTLPILMLAEKEDDFDQVLGLELGADHCLAKPVQSRVLLAHIKAILRRAQNSLYTGKKAALQFGDLCINRQTREVHFAERQINLTTSEFDLLWSLAERAGSVMLRTELAESATKHLQTLRSIDSRICRLRKKMQASGIRESKIKSIRSLGYIFTP